MTAHPDPRAISKGFQKALEEGHLERVKVYLKQPGMLEARRAFDGCTPLHLAAFTLNREICDHLIDSGADINAVNREGRTALGEVCSRLTSFNSTGLPDRVDQMAFHLIERGFDVNLGGPIFSAIRSKGAIRLQRLVECGAEIEARNSHGQTPLFFACSDANLPAVRYLFGLGADPLVRDLYGFTPLHAASIAGNKAVVKNLVGEVGLDPNLSGPPGFEWQRPLQRAASSDSMDTACVLMSLGADPRRISLEGLNQDQANQLRFPLHTVIGNDRPEAVGSLLVLGYDPQEKNDKLQTALEVAEIKSDQASLGLMRAFLARREANAAIEEMLAEKAPSP